MILLCIDRHFSICSLEQLLLGFVLTFGMVFGRTTDCEATHLVGGEMTYEYLGPNGQGENEFEVHCYIYRDCSSNNVNGTDFDGTAWIGVYQGNNLITHHS